MEFNNNYQAFLALVRGGLWEKEVQLLQYGEIDYKEIYRLAQEQSVVGLVAAGLEHIVDVKPAKEVTLSFIGEALQLEQRNTAMDHFISALVEKMRNEDIYTLLVKGQGVAQCYERPLWRACGDVDFYMSDSNFQKAKKFFRPLVEKFEPDNDRTKHINMHYDQWVVEIHSDQHCGLSFRIDSVLDEIHNGLFSLGEVRAWDINHATVYLPSPDNDIIIVFTHFLKHFYNGGLGMRQVCDWCRLLWTYKENINKSLLEKRLKKMGLTTVWKAFCAFSVKYLEMPADSVPLYSPSIIWKKKADKILKFIMKVGNMGHNRNTSYYKHNSVIVRKCISFNRRIKDIFHHMMIFPLHSIKFLVGITYNGLKAFVYGT